MEEYGFSILATIVVILLILMISPIGIAIRGSIESIVLKFDDSVSNSLTGYKIDFDGGNTSTLAEPDFNSETQYINVYRGNGGVYSDGNSVCYEIYDSSTNNLVSRTCDDPYNIEKNGKRIKYYEPIVETDIRFEVIAIYPKYSVSDLRVYDLYQNDDNPDDYYYFAESTFIHNSTDSPISERVINGETYSNQIMPLRLRRVNGNLVIHEWVEPGTPDIIVEDISGFTRVQRNFHLNMSRPEFAAGQMVRALNSQTSELYFAGATTDWDIDCDDILLFGWWGGTYRYYVFKDRLTWNSDGYWYLEVESSNEIRRSYSRGDACPVKTY